MANDLIGRKVVAEKGATAKAVIAQMREFDRQLGASDHPALSSIHRSLSAGIDALAEATDWLLATWPLVATSYRPPPVVCRNRAQ